jgi:hypothetical protein
VLVVLEILPALNASASLALGTSASRMVPEVERLGGRLPAANFWPVVSACSSSIY